MQVLITDHVVRVLGDILIAQDSKRLKSKAAKFTISGIIESVGPAYLTVRIAKTGGKKFLKEG